MEITAFFKFYGDLDADKITEYLGVKPSETWKEGQKLRDKIYAKYNKWELSTGEMNTYDIQEAMDELTKMIMPHKEKMIEISRRDGIECVFVFVVYGLCDRDDEDILETPAICFNRESLILINELNAEIDVDQYA